MKYAFAGDRNISCNILRYIIENGFKPSALLVSNNPTSSHATELKEISSLDEEFIFSGNEFREPDNVRMLEEMNLDYIFGIHFPYIIPKNVLDIPMIGFLNLHPAYLPFNKGWHTPSWAILDGTPYGATLHFMAEALDEGDIIHQKKLTVSWDDTANSLYKKVLNLEEDVFFEAFEDIVSKKLLRKPQNESGSSHNKKDLQKIQEINLEEEIKTVDLINKLRALTTNKTSELAYFKINGKQIGVRVELVEMDNL